MTRIKAGGAQKKSRTRRGGLVAFIVGWCTLGLSLVLGGEIFSLLSAPVLILGGLLYMSLPQAAIEVLDTILSWLP